MLITIRSIAVIFLIVFCTFLLTVTLSPKTFERSALSFAKHQIEIEMKQLYPALGQDTVPKGLQNLADQLGVQQASIVKQLDSKLPELIATIITSYCGCTGDIQADIDERAQSIRDKEEARFQQLGLTRMHLSEIIKGKYDTILSALRRDIIIFLGTNLVAIAFVFGATYAPSDRRRLVFYPAVLLILAVGISSGLYLFNTDWFYTIVFQNYAGYGYSAMMLVIFGFLLDIVMNRARITLQIISNLPAVFAPVC